MADTPVVVDSRYLAWQAHPNFAGVEIKPLVGRDVNPGASLTLTRLAPGAVVPEHSHAGQTESALVLAGQAHLRWAGAGADLTEGMGVTVPPGAAHSLRNTGAGWCELLAVHTPPAR